jgi:hypothetical protein
MINLQHATYKYEKDNKTDRLFPRAKEGLPMILLNNTVDLNIWGGSMVSGGLHKMVFLHVQNRALACTEWRPYTEKSSCMCRMKPLIPRMELLHVQNRTLNTEWSSCMYRMEPLHRMELLYCAEWSPYTEWSPSLYLYKMELLHRKELLLLKVSTTIVLYNTQWARTGVHTDPSCRFWRLSQCTNHLHTISN